MNASLFQQNFINESFDLIQEDQGQDNLSVTNEEDNESYDEDDEETIEKTESNSPQKVEKFEESYEIQSPMWDMESISDWGARIAGYDAI